MSGHTQQRTVVQSTCYTLLPITVCAVYALTQVASHDVHPTEPLTVKKVVCLLASCAMVVSTFSCSSESRGRDVSVAEAEAPSFRCRSIASSLSERFRA